MNCVLQANSLFAACSMLSGVNFIYVSVCECIAGCWLLASGCSGHTCLWPCIYIFKKCLSHPVYSQFLLFPVWIFHRQCISTNRTHHLLERWLKTFKFEIHHVHSIFIRLSLFMVRMVISVVGWHTVYCYSATLCSEVNYIKLNAVYVLCTHTHPQLQPSQTHTISNIFHVFS